MAALLTYATGWDSPEGKYLCPVRFSKHKIIPKQSWVIKCFFFAPD